MNQAGDIIAIFQVRMHPGVTVENSKSQKDELIVQGKGTFRYYVNAQTGESILCDLANYSGNYFISTAGALIGLSV